MTTILLNSIIFQKKVDDIKKNNVMNNLERTNASPMNLMSFLINNVIQII